MRTATRTKTLKLLHVIASTGYCAALVTLILMHASLPEPSELEQFATMRIAMGNVVRWLLLPSTALVVVTGLFSMALNDVYKNAGWVWAKLATGVLVMEGTLVYVQAPMQRAARDAEAALAGEMSITDLSAPLGPEFNSFWVILGVAVVNIVLGVYRPSLVYKVKD